MRKRNVKNELKIFPSFLISNGQLIKIPVPIKWDGYQLHHFITTQWEQTHKKEFEEVKHLQKLIFMPAQMHMELHSKHTKFKEKYGFDTEELLFDWRKYMISAKTARANSEQNQIKIRIASVEKAIKNAVDKGKCEIFLLGEIEKEVFSELDKAGFEYEKQANGYKIFW